MFKKFLQLFKPNDFENNFYGWLTNQISHTALSCSVVFLFMLIPIFNVWVFAFIFSIFWIFWEIRHLKISGNLKDFYQDLFFELSGIVIFIFPKYLIFVVLVFIISILKNIK